MNRLNKYLKSGITQFHLVQNCIEELNNAGFKCLEFDDEWNLEEGGKYFVTPYNSMLIPFVVGKSSDSFRITAAHTDFPMLKLKSNPEINQNGYLKANVEPYGGLILSTWFDRPLGLAGKVVLRGGSVFKPKVMLYDSKDALFIIPNLAPHLKGKETKGDIDIQKEIMPLFHMSDEDANKKDYLIELICNDLQISKEDILDYDLYLYSCDDVKNVGLNKEFIVSPRLDNISSVAAIMDGLLGNEIGNCVAIGALFDNEEIGSKSKQGADSNLLQMIIQKISTSLDNKLSLLKSFVMSVDVAHAMHPNYAEKSDITNEVKLGKGLVLKTSASQRYLTDSEAGAVIIGICEENNIKVQRQVNRSGMPGGQTLGPIISSYIPIKGVDLGVPMLAMHSACETIHKEDYLNLSQLIKHFYEIYN